MIRSSPAVRSRSPDPPKTPRRRSHLHDGRNCSVFDLASAVGENRGSPMFRRLVSFGRRIYTSAARRPPRVQNGPALDQPHSPTFAAGKQSCRLSARRSGSTLRSSRRQLLYPIQCSLRPHESVVASRASLVPADAAEVGVAITHEGDFRLAGSLSAMTPGFENPRRRDSSKMALGCLTQT